MLAVDLVVHVTRPADNDIVRRSEAGTLLDLVQAPGRREALDSMEPPKVSVCLLGRIGSTIWVAWNLGHFGNENTRTDVAESAFEVGRGGGHEAHENRRRRTWGLTVRWGRRHSASPDAALRRSM